MKQILIRIAHEVEQALTLLVNDLVFGKKARRGRKMAMYKAPKPLKAPRIRRTAYRTTYKPQTSPRMVIVHIHEGAIVHF